MEHCKALADCLDGPGHNGDSSANLGVLIDGNLAALAGHGHVITKFVFAPSDPSNDHPLPLPEFG